MPLVSITPVPHVLLGFQGHNIFVKSNIRKMARLKGKVTITQEET